MIKGFSKLSREDKIKHLTIDTLSLDTLNAAINQSKSIAQVIDDLSENTISHFPFPFGLAPNVMVNGSSYILPLVTEESSVVAAIAKAAKFWSDYGGFKTWVVGTKKKGQVHFFWHGEPHWLSQHFNAIKEKFINDTQSITEKMEKRGGGIKNIELWDKTADLANYFQIDVSFETKDAMGANFINTCLEQMALSLKEYFNSNEIAPNLWEINMAILSNYTPNSLAVAELSCPMEDFNAHGLSLGIENYTEKFIRAVDIAKVSPSRAVTHNKGIYNGVDALAIATGNDWRAIEACGHAYASKNGNYQSLSKAFIKNEHFVFQLELPLAVGTVGGVSNLHPLAKVAMQILKNPNAEMLMQLMAVSGLAANYAALGALTSSGIQKGHMKMHLNNILTQFNASEKEKEKAIVHFTNQTVSYAAVEAFLKDKK